MNPLYLTDMDIWMIAWQQANPTADVALKVTAALLALWVSWYLIRHPEVLVADE